MIDTETILHDGLAATRRLEASESDLRQIRARVSAKSASRKHPIRRRPAVWAACGALTVGALAVSPAGAAISDVASNFAGYFSGEEGGSPGQGVTSSEVPPGWLSNPGTDDRRILAKSASGEYELFVARERDGQIITFAYNGAQWTGSQASWEENLASEPIFVLGAPDTKQAEATGRRPIFGIAAGNVKNVEAVYANGDRVAADASGGGFVLVLDRERTLFRVTALDSDSREVGSLPGDRYYNDP